MTTLRGVPAAPPRHLVTEARSKTVAWRATLRLRALAAPLVVLSAVVACASDGRDLAEPADWQTTTTRPPPPTSAPEQESGSSGMSLVSTEFLPGAAAPLDVTCAGANRAPELGWTDVPGDGAELAVALSDQTDPADPLLLWLVTGIDPTLGGLAAGQLPPGAAQPLNDYGQAGWGNPCLETLKEGHLDLQFRLYVLPAPSGVSDGDPGNEAWDEVAAAATDSASLLMRIEASP